MDILVTGSTGFIGRRLVWALRELGGVRIIEATRHHGVDLRDPRTLASIPEAEVVVHLAGITGVRRAQTGVVDSLDENVAMTRNLLEFARWRGISKFVLASSYVYGVPEYLPVDENHPVRPTTPYMASKARSEELCREFAHRDGLATLALRIFNVYGYGQGPAFFFGSLMTQLLEGRQWVELWDPVPRRDFVAVKDVVQALVAGIFAYLWDDQAWEVCNVGSGRSHSVDEVARRILEEWNLRKMGVPPIFLRYTGGWADPIPDIVADITKAKRRLGWAPQIDLDVGIKQLVDEAIDAMGR